MRAMGFRKNIRQIIHRLGYDIQPIKGGVRDMRIPVGGSYALMRGLGFYPKTVVDVGVATGTMELYAAYPDSYFLLIEPLVEYEPNLHSILKQYRGSYVLAAAGSGTNPVNFNVHKDLMGSSLYKSTMGAGVDGRAVTIPMVRIDDILEERRLTGPYLIKIDAQGAGLDILDGAQKALSDAEAAVLEISFFQFAKGAPQFFDVILYMKNHGFVAYDIIQGWNRPLDDALGQIDMVFVKENGMFRQNHSYAKQ
jgi:FkbM family methyltransferase